MTCQRCEKRLFDGLDTFGPVHAPVCQACWLAYREPVTTIIHTLEFDERGNIITEGIRVDRVEEENEVRA
jgi:hypothetical protein